MMMHFFSKNTIAALILGLLVCPATSKAGLDYKQIALTGELAAGDANGAVYDTLVQPQLNDADDVAFYAILADGAGPPVPANSRVALFGPTAGGGSPLGIVAREDLPAPGTTDDAFFDGFYSFVLNNTADYAFPADLRTGTGTAVTDNRNKAFFGPTAGAGSPLGLLAREDGPAGTTDGAEFADFLRTNINNNGDSSFVTRLRTRTGGEPVTGDNDEALVLAADGGLLWIFREGAPAPGANDGALLGNFLRTAMNDSRDFAFLAGLYDSSGVPLPSDNTAIFGPAAGAGSSVELLYRRGEAASGDVDGALFDDFVSNVALNNHGEVAFSAMLRTGSGGPVADNQNGVIYGPVAGAGSDLGVLVREGDTAWGTSDGALFGNTGAVFSSIVLNDQSDLAFKALLTSSDGMFLPGEINEALYARVEGQLQLVVRDGDKFAVTLPDGVTSVLRTVESIDFQPGGLNNNSLVAFGLRFTDGSSGVFVADLNSVVPEPATLLQLGCGVLLIAFRRSHS